MRVTPVHRLLSSGITANNEYITLEFAGPSPGQVLTLGFTRSLVDPVMQSLDEKKRQLDARQAGETGLHRHQFQSRKVVSVASSIEPHGPHGFLHFQMAEGYEQSFSFTPDQLDLLFETITDLRNELSDLNDFKDQS